MLVVTGDDKSKTPHKVVQVLDGGRRLVIEGVRVVKKHVRRGHPKSPQGGRLDIEMPLDASNVAYYCESCNKGVKLGMRVDGNGQKERFCRKCGASAGSVGAAKPDRVKQG